MGTAGLVVLATSRTWLTCRRSQSEGLVHWFFQVWPNLFYHGDATTVSSNWNAVQWKHGIYLSSIRSFFFFSFHNLHMKTCGISYLLSDNPVIGGLVFKFIQQVYDWCNWSNNNIPHLRSVWITFGLSAFPVITYAPWVLEETYFSFLFVSLLRSTAVCAGLILALMVNVCGNFIFFG